MMGWPLLSNVHSETCPVSKSCWDNLLFVRGLSLWYLITFVFEAYILSLFWVVTSYSTLICKWFISLISVNEREMALTALWTRNFDIWQLWSILWKGMYSCNDRITCAVCEYTMSKLWNIFLHVNQYWYLAGLSLNHIIFICQVD